MGSTFKGDVQAILKNVVKQIEKYLASDDESVRVDALEKTLKLSRVLEKPKDAVLKLSLSPVLLMALKVGHDLNIFTSLTQSGPVTATQLAAAKNADVTLVERILRVLATIDFVEKLEHGLYAPSLLSYEMAQRTTIGVMDSLFCESLPAITRTPEFLQITGYQNPVNPYAGPMQYAFGTDLAIWDWLADHIEALSRFNTYMEGIRGSRPHWVDWFPVQQQVLRGASQEVTQPLLVDIAGGRGHDIAYFDERFPGAPGRLILEDLPSVIDDIQNLNSKVERIKHDFFTAQPIKGARVYYLKFILHDWCDEKCRIILDHIAAAMKKGYSKLLIEEFILSDTDSYLLPVLLDMIVMVFCPGMERTRSQWAKLLKVSGLAVRNFWFPKGDGQGIIEAELE
ncbi:S-adenosyl-L-methionine-dependent methyltransferase [Aspergillus alliaceus]|uniref:S-adenosyl-L-methionine-dependent methyltransferase n=1 Tax=Petromyces alliaceus TaxID=209559 RepID=UPI0012A42480|nr:S-adenosyl-L-methionine-dependent methyltransferase [Aspergillus alliaceus]KAB8226869.1 S-adenosyl-L-methionine-dependent methyltransferase [Aspergillus alliaceus]